MCYRCADALMHCLEHVRMIQLLTHRCADENISGYADVLPRCKCADVLTCADVLMCSFVDVLTYWHCDVLVGCSAHLQMCHVLTVTLCWRCYTYWQHVNWFIGHQCQVRFNWSLCHTAATNDVTSTTDFTTINWNIRTLCTWCTFNMGMSILCCKQPNIVMVIVWHNNTSDE